MTLPRTRHRREARKRAKAKQRHYEQAVLVPPWLVAETLGVLTETLGVLTAHLGISNTFNRPIRKPKV